jgi:histidyl-tRNA synthetase
VKPKVPAQFKAAENNGVPFAIFLGDDEVAANKVKIKEMGLQDGHPEKEGILVDQKDMVAEVKARLQRKKELDQVAQQAEGLKVVDGIKGEEATPGQGAPAGADPAP